MDLKQRFLTIWFGDKEGNGKLKTKEEADTLLETYDLYRWFEKKNWIH